MEAAFCSHSVWASASPDHQNQAVEVRVRLPVLLAALCVQNPQGSDKLAVVSRVYYPVPGVDSVKASCCQQRYVLSVCCRAWRST